MIRSSCPLPAPTRTGTMFCHASFHRLNRPLFHVAADDPVTMAGVDQNVGRLDVQFLLKLPADVGQEVVPDAADFGDRHGVDGDDDRRGARRRSARGPWHRGFRPAFWPEDW